MKKSRKAILGAAVFAASIGMSAYAAASDLIDEKNDAAGKPQSSSLTYNPEDDEQIALYGPPPVIDPDMLGDLDGDGKINAADLSIAKNILLYNQGDLRSRLALDVTGRDYPFELDMLILKAYALSQITAFDDPRYTEPQDLYGPPFVTEDETTVEEETTTDEDISDIEETTYTTTQILYGPPFVTEEETALEETTIEEKTVEETTVEETDESYIYTPETDLPQPVYGPPEYFE